ERDIAVRISEDDLTRRAEERLRAFLDRFLVLFRIGRTLSLVELGHRVLDDLRVRDQIIAHDPFDFALLAGGQFIGLRNLWWGYRKKRRTYGGDKARSECH